MHVRTMNYLCLVWFGNLGWGMAQLWRMCLRWGRPWFNPWVGKIPEELNGWPLQYSCLENPMDVGAWWATVHGVVESDTTKQITLELLSFILFIVFPKVFNTMWCGFYTMICFHCGSDGKASACNVGDPGSIPGSGRSPGEGNGNPLQYSCLENSMDRGAWWPTVHGVTKSQTRLLLHTHSHCIHSRSYFNF